MSRQPSAKISRRQALARAGLSTGAVLAAALPNTHPSAGSPAPRAMSRFIYCLNTATIRGQKLGIAKEIEIAAQAGYHAIEPWIDSIDAYVKGGGSLKELRKQIEDCGLSVPSAIGFAQWIVDDPSKRAQGLEHAKRDLDAVAQLGGKRLAAPPAGATEKPGLDLLQAAERYRALLELGDQFGVVPQLELWGFSKNLNRIGECAEVAIETGHSKACILLDVYHIYKGGSDYHGLALLSGSAVHLMHMNDYPSAPPRSKIDDSYRVFPGDGVAPIGEILSILHRAGGDKVLSLELFNREYWAKDPLRMARLGLEKMKSVVEPAAASQPA